MCITWPHVCFTIHLLWCIAYTVIGTIQVIIGVFFLALPIFKLGSNIWVGIWNITFGIGGAVYALMGKWTLSKQRIFLYLATSVLIANVINLVLLEIGEWHILLPENIKKLIEQGNLKTLVLYARTITSLSTIVAAAISFFDSQITFCSMQYHERYHHKKAKEKQDVLSDTEYVLPRVKSDSDENENASYYNNKQYPQSWVYETQTAESSTVNSTAPNRHSGTSSDNLLYSKRTSSEAEFKDISSQNLNVVEQPVVVVENTSDYTDRQLHYMASFSRTPSPVPGSSDTSSENSCSMKGTPAAEKADEAAAAYRSRLNSAKSANAVPVDRSPPTSISPRPPSISGIEQLQQESQFAGLRQESVSNKSFKISADQIFIPLKDETVIRVNDEIFITKPSLKADSHQQQQQQQQQHHETEPPLPPKKEVLSTRPFLPEVVQVICKERIYTEPTTNATQTKAPSSSSPVDKQYSVPSPVEPTLPFAADAKPYSLPLPVEPNDPVVRASALVHEDTASLKPEQSLEQAMEQYLCSSPVLDIEPVASDRRKSITSPLLERQNPVIDADDATTIESETYMLSWPQFDRQDTVICCGAKTPTPPPPATASERQSFMERQDAIVSPKDDKSYQIPPPPPSPSPSPRDQDVDASFPSPLETEASSASGQLDEEPRQESGSGGGGSGDDIESNNSNNASTDDKETIVDFKSSDDDIEMPVQDVDERGGGTPTCDTPDFIEGTGRVIGQASAAAAALGNEIDNIFRIAEDPGRLEDSDRELFDVRPNNIDDDISIEHIPPPPEIDASVFANVPPPEETEEVNGVDPDEWDESDDDSMDSSCVQRIPPPPSSSN